MQKRRCELFEISSDNRAHCTPWYLYPQEIDPGSIQCLTETVSFPEGVRCVCFPGLKITILTENSSVYFRVSQNLIFRCHVHFSDRLPIILSVCFTLGVYAHSYIHSNALFSPKKHTFNHFHFRTTLIHKGQNSSCKYFGVQAPFTLEFIHFQATTTQYYC